MTAVLFSYPAHLTGAARQRREYALRAALRDVGVSTTDEFGRALTVDAMLTNLLARALGEEGC